MVKTIAVFVASLVLTIFASATISMAQTYPTTGANMNTSDQQTTTTDTTNTRDNQNTGTVQGQGGSGTVLPSQAPSTGLGGLSD